jgi:RNA polymerase sigma factor (sigma-70 family)
MNEKINIYKEFLNGNREGSDIIYIIHREELIGYGLSLRARLHVVEDAVSDAFLLLLEHIGTFKDDDHIIRFLYSVVWRKCQTGRREVRRLGTLSDEIENMPDPDAVQSLDLMESAVYSRWRMRKIMAMVEKLPKQRREDFHARFIECKSIKEIAQERSVSTDTVHQNIELALKNLRKSLKDNGLNKFRLSLTLLLPWVL